MTADKLALSFFFSSLQILNPVKYAVIVDIFHIQILYISIILGSDKTAQNAVLRQAKYFLAQQAAVPQYTSRSRRESLIALSQPLNV